MTIFLLIAITISFNIQIDKFVYRSYLETTIFAFFELKYLNFTAINLILTIAKFTTRRKNEITLQTIVKQLRAITMCCAFTPDCWFDNSSINLIEDVYGPNTK